MLTLKFKYSWESDNAFKLAVDYFPRFFSPGTALSWTMLNIVLLHSFRDKIWESWACFSCIFPYPFFIKKNVWSDHFEETCYYLNSDFNYYQKKIMAVEMFQYVFTLNDPDENCWRKSLQTSTKILFITNVTFSALFKNSWIYFHTWESKANNIRPA